MTRCIPRAVPTILLAFSLAACLASCDSSEPAADEISGADRDAADSPTGDSTSSELDSERAGDADERDTQSGDATRIDDSGSGGSDLATDTSDDSGAGGNGGDTTPANDSGDVAPDDGGSAGDVDRPGACCGLEGCSKKSSKSECIGTFFAGRSCERVSCGL